MDASSGIDLDNLESVDEDQGQWVDLLDRRGEPWMYTAGIGADNQPIEKQARIRVAGTYSKVYRRHIEALRGRGAKQTKKQTGGEVTAEVIESAAVCCLEWEGFAKGKQPYPCTRTAAIDLLTRAPWVLEQVQAAMVDHAGFFPKPSSS
jgi:hypothetical protein